MWKKIKDYFQGIEQRELALAILLILNVFLPPSESAQINTLFICGMWLQVWGMELKTDVEVSILPENDTKT